MSEKNVPLIKTVALKKYFQTPRGLLHAVDGIDLSIFSGETLGVVGESGCGKSTLGRTILRLVPHTSGDIFYDGESIIRKNANEMRRMRQKMQIIFQDPYSSLDPRMTVSDLISEYMLVNRTYSTRVAVQAETKKLMDIVGLASRFADAYPHELDGGRRQRIGIARALSLNPQFIVCDEPVSALDVSIQAQILNLLIDIQKERGLSYLFITHNLSVVKHISDKIAVMYLGKCVELAPSDELFQNPRHPYTKALLDAIPVPDIHMRDREIRTISGEVSNPINPKPGCRFAARCSHCHDKCREIDPEFQEVGPDHFVACWLMERQDG